VPVLVDAFGAEVCHQRNQQARGAQRLDDPGFTESARVKLGDRLGEVLWGGAVVIRRGIRLEVAACPGLAG
jgi:hypothetical protein